MNAFFELLSQARDLAPHGYCLLWNPALVWTHVVSDALIAAAYFSIPVALVRFVRKRRDIEFSGIFWLFAVFILACGLTHVMAIWTLWNPDYIAEGAVKVVTAIASVGTVIVLWPLIPKALAIPSPLQLRNANAELNEALLRAEEQARQREAAEAALVQMQKMEAVGQLTGGIAHDFNNMMSIVLGSLDIASRRVAQGRGAEVEQFIGHAKEGARRAADLTARLMAFARQQPLEPKTLNINELIVRFSELLRRTIGEQVQLETVLGAGVWAVKADPHQLESSIVNLCVNARDAMPGGGKLTIETANAHVDDRYAAQHGIDAGQYVLICVSDTGTGMAPHVVERAFDPFFTTKDVGQGTGLGLSQVFGFIKQSGGHVKIYSELGHGTTVKLYLPRTIDGQNVATNPAPGESAPPVGARAQPGETVLIVEDEALVRAMAVEALGELGYNVVEAHDGRSALEIAAGLGRLDLVLTDVVMPEMNGAQLAAALRERYPGVRTLFMTGYTRNAIVHNGTLDPGVMLLAKPFSVADLAAKVRAAIDG